VPRLRKHDRRAQYRRQVLSADARLRSTHEELRLRDAFPLGQVHLVEVRPQLGVENVALLEAHGRPGRQLLLGRADQLAGVALDVGEADVVVALARRDNKIADEVCQLGERLGRGVALLNGPDAEMRSGWKKSGLSRREVLVSRAGRKSGR